MSRTPLPDDIRRFVLTSVPSVPYIEALLLLRREAASSWTAERLASRIYVPQERAAELLEALRASGMAEPDGGVEGAYRYQPPAQLQGLLDSLADHYVTSLLAITDLIHSGMNRRASQFADAFKWRRDP